MKPALIVLSILFLGTASGCGMLSEPDEARPRGIETKSLSVSEQLDWAIVEFNAGRTGPAKKTLELVVEAASRSAPETQAVAHFYLAAVYWDLGAAGMANRHLKQCVSLRPDYQPDWKFIAPSLRKRYEALQ